MTTVSHEMASAPGDKTLTETRRKLNITFSSGIPTNKQDLLHNKSDRCCKMSVTPVMLTKKHRCIIFLVCYAS